VFQGASALNLDAKGRMTIPARHRDALLQLQCEGRVSRLPNTRMDACCSSPALCGKSHREQIAAWPMSASAWQRIFLGNASDVEMDGSPVSILIAPELRSAVALTKRSDVARHG
jgi:MraZ protein